MAKTFEPEYLWISGSEPGDWVGVEPCIQGEWASLYDYYDPGFRAYCEEQLSKLEELRAGWDGESAQPISPAIIDSARQFVGGLPDYLAWRPLVAPLVTGGVQFEWIAGEKSLELEFESPNRVHYLKWDPRNQIEDEDVLHLPPGFEEAVDMIRWFTRAALDG